MDSANKEAIQALLAGIEYLIDRNISIAPFDKVKNGKIIGQNIDGTYKVSIENNIYNVPALGTSGLSAGNVVKILIPQNEYSNMFILNAGGGGGGGGGSVSSVSVQNAENGGLSVSGSPITSSGIITIGHSNTVPSAQTTQGLYPITIDINGHIASYGNAIDIPNKTSDLDNDSGFITNTVNNLTNYELKTNTGTTILASVDSLTHTVIIQLKNSEGTVLSTGTIQLNTDDVLEGSINKYVTDAEKSIWNSKQDQHIASIGSLVVSSWDLQKTQTISITGVTASNTVIISPSPASQLDYVNSGIICTVQGAATLTFTCETIPTNTINVNVVILD